MKRASIGDIHNQTFDVIVIGGGFSGISTARDAAMRGLSTLVVDKGDWTSGTSSRSTKYLHGGVRYLEYMDFPVIKEGVQEREILDRIAPHQSVKAPFIFAMYGSQWPGPLALHAGLTIYDTFARIPKDRRHFMLSKRKLAGIEPYLTTDGLKGGGWYYDGLTDDVRLAIDVLKSAADAGAVAANYMTVTDLTFGSDGMANGVRLRDNLTGEEGEVHAKKVLNATGMWSDDIRRMEDPNVDTLIAPSKGVHLTVRHKDFPINHVIFLPHPTSSRVSCLTPSIYGDLVYIALTDTFYDGPLDHVVPDMDDVDYLLELVNFAMPHRKFGYEDVVSAWAGCRPLVKPRPGQSSSKVSRQHIILTGPKGVITIAGGKMTTARVMGEHLVDEALRQMGVTNAPACKTAVTPISGGSLDGGHDAHVRQVTRELGLDASVAERLGKVYGSNFDEIVAYIKADPEAGVDLGEGHHVSIAEVRYGLEHEMAMTLRDFMERRATRFVWSADGGLSIAEPIVEEMARHLGWDDAEKTNQIEAYADWVQANRVPMDKIQGK